MQRKKAWINWKTNSTDRGITDLSGTGPILWSILSTVAGNRREVLKRTRLLNEQAERLKKEIGRCAKPWTGKAEVMNHIPRFGWFSWATTLFVHVFWDALWLIYISKRTSIEEFFLIVRKLPTMPHRRMRHWHCFVQKRKWYCSLLSQCISHVLISCPMPLFGKSLSVTPPLMLRSFLLGGTST